MTGKNNYNCGECNAKITKSQGSVQCEQCKSWVHLTCSNMDELEIKVMQKLKNKWHCSMCKQRAVQDIRKSMDPLGHAPSQIPPKSSLSSEERIMESINELKKELGAEIRSLKETLNFYSEKYEEQKNKNLIFTQEINNLKKENEIIHQELKKLKNQTDRKDKESRTNNIVIMGVTHSLEEAKTSPTEIKTKIGKVLSYIDPNLKHPDFKVSILNRNKPDSPVLVSFNTTEQKNMILAMRREKGKILSSNCGLPGTNLIFLNEDLTKEQRELFRLARSLKNHGFKFIWVKHGVVYVRKSENSDVIKVSNEADINQLKVQ